MCKHLDTEAIMAEDLDLHLLQSNTLQGSHALVHLHR